jgi:hypothetical protein
LPASVVTAGFEPVTLGWDGLTGHTKLAVLWKRGREVRTVTGVPARALEAYAARILATSLVEVGST